MQMLETLYKAQGRHVDEQYWGLLRRVDGTFETQRQMIEIYNLELADSDRDTLGRAMRDRSLSGGELPPIGRIPGRSTLTAAFVDLTMRRQLSFVWRAFFDGSAESTGLLQSFENLRRAFSDNAYADQYLLVIKPVQTADAGILSLSKRDELAGAMLPGDSIVVRCGALTHQAVVWSVDRTKGELVVLDPFFQFWQPTHNSCVQRFELTPYKAGRVGRDLVVLSLSEVERMLEAVIATRDRPAAAGPLRSDRPAD